MAASSFVRNLDRIRRTGRLATTFLTCPYAPTDVDKLVEAYLRQQLAQEVIKFRTRPMLELVADQVEVTTVNAGVFPRIKGPSRAD